MHHQSASIIVLTKTRELHQYNNKTSSNNIINLNNKSKNNSPTIDTMHSFLTTSVLVASLLARSNAGYLKGGNPDPAASSTTARKLTFGPAVPGLFTQMTNFLSGLQEVGPVEVSTTGVMQVAFDEDFENMAYVIEVDVGKGEDAPTIFQAHFHCGKAGVNGPVFAFVYDNTVDTQEVKNGILTIEGILTYEDFVPDVDFAADSICDAPITTIASVYELVEARKVYVNVHSEENPGGEIRAQLFVKPKY
jgi:CHRD domain